MTHLVRIYNGFGAETPFNLELAPNGNDIDLRIDGSFAGRDIREEVALEALYQLAGDSPFRYLDLLGLTFETNGTDIEGVISVGSGTEKFSVKKADLAKAVHQLGENE